MNDDQQTILERAADAFRNAHSRDDGGMARAYERGFRLGYMRAVRDMAAAGKRLLDDLKASVDQDAPVSDERAP